MKFRKFIQKENRIVRQTYFSGRRMHRSAEETGI
jgi:hypothetical protein